ncbi:POK6 protein, partial [Crypturellus soui]|nr:POK6 protein [Crypturellus soui]
LQRLLGAINHIGPVTGLTMEELRPLFVQLQGDPDLNSPRQLMEESQQALTEVAHAIEKRQSYRIQKELEIDFIIIPNSYQPYQPFAALMQWDVSMADLFRVL